MIIPILRIFDYEKAKEFYLDFLGLQLDWTHQFEDNMPLYVQVSSEGDVLHLSEHHGDASPGSSIRIQKKSLKQYQKKLLEKNYPHMKPGIEETPWGTLEVTVVDPFSNRIIFYEDKK
ncbi:glyoxalase superfamily protein [Alkalicoccobacillus porphyridii]|uniref:Bleomycin resistance protein n=1 Tax=Alkalicoccobacillus porphyridii TaxID=2597270 RepID=A0A553ZWL5_9BACI|nr:glyoxalase superfamily protein [Alkalicoccobacillus porphyridii]TSB45726.1 VOC family protein [Alkalicoccobacillus porphyridii]